MVTNPHLQAGLQSQQQQPSAPVPPMNQPENFQVTPQQFNEQFQQPPLTQISPIMAQTYQYSPHVLPPYFSQYSTVNSSSIDSSESLLATVF